jgi:DNA-binding transcriptional regulator YiaG
MPNIGSLLKEEITRLARKETRSQVEALRKASGQYRRDIAELKRQLAQLGRDTARMQRTAVGRPASTPSGVEASNFRFTAKGLPSQRKRLGLSAAEYAKLVGVSQQSIYNWESGATRPRPAQIAILASLRALGKREARARLDALDTGTSTSRRKRQAS